MGWSFRRGKSFGLFKLNFSKSGIGYSFGVKGARIGVNAKGKKYIRGSIPGTGLYYQSSLPDAQQLQQHETPQSTASISPLGILMVALVVGLIIYAMSSSSSKPVANYAPVSQVPPVAPVTPKRVVKKYRRRHVAHRAPATMAVSANESSPTPVTPESGGDIPK